MRNKKENSKPESGKIYALSGGPNTPSIARGDGWKESEVKNKISDGLNECGKFFFLGDATSSLKI